MLAFDLIIRWLHILGAIMLVGSTIFMRCVYVPAKECSGGQPDADFAEWTRKLWARMVMISSGLLLVSGLTGFAMLMKRYDISKESFPGSMYQMIFGIKFLLALIVFFLAAAISGRSGLAQKLRQREKTWLMVNMVLAIVVVCLAGIMRMADRSEKSTSSLQQPESAVVQLDRATTATGDP